MFDIGVSELLVIGVVALIVIGPERLPKVARTAGILFGRMQRYVATVKADINRELEDFEQLKDLKNLKKEVEQAGGEIESSMRQNMLEAENQVKQITDDVGANLASAARPFEELPTATLETAGSQHPANPVTASVPSPLPTPRVAAEAPQLELALDQPTSSPAAEKPATGSA